VFLALHFYTWISSLKLTKVYISTTLVCIHPLITTLLSSIILKESLKPSAILGILITILGSSTVSCSATSNNNGDVDVYGALLALIGAFLASAYILAGRYVRVRASKLGSYVIPTYATSSLTLFLITLIECNSVIAIDLSDVPWMVVLALGPMMGGHTLLNYMLRYVNASIASVPIVLEPVGASIPASLILLENMTQVSCLGMILTVVGLIMITLTPSNNK